MRWTIGHESEKVRRDGGGVEVGLVVCVCVCILGRAGRKKDRGIKRDGEKKKGGGKGCGREIEGKQRRHLK